MCFVLENNWGSTCVMFGQKPMVYFAGKNLDILASFAIIRRMMIVKRGQLKTVFSLEMPCCCLQLFYKSSRPHFPWVYRRKSFPRVLRSVSYYLEMCFEETTC